jgi:hypothetical protein
MAHTQVKCAAAIQADREAARIRGCRLRGRDTTRLALSWEGGDIAVSCYKTDAHILHVPELARIRD